MRNCITGVFVGNYGSAGDQTDIQITGNTFRDCWDHGVYFNYGLGGVISDNTFRNCTMPIVGRGYNLSITGNTMVGLGTARTASVGISIRDARNCVISNNTMRGNCDNAGSSAIVDLVNIQEVELSGNIVSDNVIENTGTGAIVALRIGSVAVTEVLYGNKINANTITGRGIQFDGLLSFRTKSGFMGYNNEANDNLVYVNGASEGIFAARQRLLKMRGNSVRYEYTPSSAETRQAYYLFQCQDTVLDDNEAAIMGVNSANLTLQSYLIEECTRLVGRRNRSLKDAATAATVTPLTLSSDTGSTFVGNNWQVFSGSATHDFPSIAAGASSTTTVAVAGVLASRGRVDSIRASGTLSGLTLTGYVSADNTVTLVAANNTGDAIDLPSLTFTVFAENDY